MNLPMRASSKPSREKLKSSQSHSPTIVAYDSKPEAHATRKHFPEQGKVPMLRMVASLPVHSNDLAPQTAYGKGFAVTSVHFNGAWYPRPSIACSQLEAAGRFSRQRPSRDYFPRMGGW